MELTGEQLEKRAIELTVNKWGRLSPTNVSRWQEYYETIFDHLKDARKSLRLLERAPHTFTCESEFEKTMEDSETPDDLNPCICGLIPHTAHLKALLGITDTNTDQQ